MIAGMIRRPVFLLLYWRVHIWPDVSNRSPKCAIVINTLLSIPVAHRLEAARQVDRQLPGLVGQRLSRQRAERMREEYLRAREEGTLDRDMFAPADWEMLNLMMDDFDAFMARFESGM